MTTTLNTATADRNVFDLHCARCGEPADLNSPGINIGDLRYHLACAPACTTCGRTLHNGEVGWVVQGNVVSTPWGYAVRPTLVWCPDCLDAVPRTEPAALD
jgi:hypothetical protein